MAVSLNLDSLSPTDKLPNFHPHHQNSGVKASSPPDEIHRLQIQVRPSRVFFCLSIKTFWIFILGLFFVSASQVGKVHADPDPPAGHPPHGLYFCNRRVHTLHYQPASRQALHRSLLLLLSGSTLRLTKQPGATHHARLCWLALFMAWQFFGVT